MDGTGRWEWRTFARNLAHIGPRPPADRAGIPITREQYIVSVVSVHNVKIRDDCLDIKTLVNVDALGLQQWLPTLKVPFPIDAAALDATWIAWGLPHPVVERTRCTIDEFFNEIIATEKCLRAVSVKKQRMPMLVQGCPGEHVELKIDGEGWESISFEHADPYRVWRAVRALGLENAENTSYPLALKRIVGFQLVEKQEKMETV